MRDLSRLKRVAIVALVGWTVMIGVSLMWSLVSTKREGQEVARAFARASFEKDVLFRRWNAMHGGVYAPVTEQTPSNPHLDTLERDVVTPSGRMLTKVNPAYMTRQLHALGAENKGIQGHITSLKPIRPENVADDWETEALEAFERGDVEFSGIEIVEGTSYMRLMRPLATEESCLKCHAKQGYSVGDIRGGISISVPMEPISSITDFRRVSIVTVHGILWILGLAAIGLSARRLRKQALESVRAEQELKDSEGKFRHLFESTSDAVMLFDEGQLCDCNQATLTTFGCASRDDFCGKHPSELSPPTQPCGADSMTLANERIATAMKEGSNRFEWTHQRMDGEVFPAEVLLNSMMMEGETILQAVVRDISERKDAETRLRHQHAEQEVLNSLLKNSLQDQPLRVSLQRCLDLILSVPFLSCKPEGSIFVADGDTLELCVQKNLAEPLLDLCANVPFGKCLCGRAAQTGRTVMAECLDERHEIRFEGIHEHGHCCVPLLREDRVLGVLNLYLARGQRLAPHETQFLQAIGKVLASIIDRKEGEIELRRLKHAIEQSPSTIVITDTAGVIEYVNPAFAESTGYSAEKAIGLNPRILKSGEQSPEYYADLWRTISEGNVWRGEFHNRKKNGELYWESATISPVKNEEGDVSHFIAIKEDITGRKRSEQALEEAKEAALAAAKAKSEFLANMSHEIRTPMNGVIGMTDLLLDTGLDAEQRQYAEVVMDSADSLLTVINDILDFSKIESGKLNLEFLEFDLWTTLEEMSDALALRAQEKGLEYVLLIEPDVPHFLRGDPGRLRQVLTNLIGNAIKFTQKGETTVRASVRNVTADEAVIAFSVSDTGIGIPQDKIESLFEAFTQADASTTRKFGGTGLGLTISKQLVDLMQGEIGAESVEGQGSTFNFTATFELSSEPEISLTYEDIENQRILFVDDNDTNRLLLRNQLRSWRCEYDEAPNGVIALQKLADAEARGRPFKIAILDMQMPDMDGETLGRRIKENPSLREISLVMMTSIGQRGDAARFKEIGFEAYLTKPVKQSQLFDCLSAIAGVHSSAGSSQDRPIITRHTLKEVKRGGDFRILLAEDNRTNQIVALKVLEKLGYRADVAVDGLEAVKALETTPYDLVLMDVQMPHMDGLEATRAIRGDESAVLNRGVPIVAMTAHAMKGDRDRCLEAGMDDYVTKPVNSRELAEAIEKHLSTPVAAVSETVPTPKPSNGTVFDRSVLFETLDGDEDLMKQVLGVFLDDTTEQMANLKEALDEENATLVERQAHSLKGSGANVGAHQFRTCAARLEEAGREKDLVAAKNEFETLGEDFASFRTHVKKEIGE